MVLAQKWPFFQLYFSQYRPGKCLLRYSITIKRLSRLKKQEVQKVENVKILKFLHGFGVKTAIFQTFFFWQYMSGKCVLRYSRTNKRLSRL